MYIQIDLTSLARKIENGQNIFLHNVSKYFCVEWNLF